ncbi:zinc-dependent metalloprotease family protein [Streptomyces sp. T-3]|nr:zinc-dependent metalloprotease family protein [Streptomyces sp. T-3]
MRRHLRRTAVVTAALTLSALPALPATADEPLPPALTGAGYLKLHAEDFAWLCDLEPDEFRDDALTLSMDFKRLPGLKETYQAELPVAGEAERFVDEEGEVVFWVGEVEDEPGSFVYLAVEGACTDAVGDDDVSGFVDAAEHMYVIGSNPEDSARTEVVDIDPSRLPSPQPPPIQLPDDIPDKLPPAPSQQQLPSNRAPLPKKRAVIDVAVGYTPRAKQGLKDGSGNNTGIPKSMWKPRDIKDEIRAGARQTNRILADSGVNAEIRIVHTFEVKGGPEDASKLRETIEKGTGPAGKLAHQVRDRYGADLVSVWSNVAKPVNTPYTAGEASMAEDANGRTLPLSARTAHAAYNSVDVFSAVSNAAFAHELGHNMGLFHDQRTLDYNLDSALQAYDRKPNPNYSRAELEAYLRSTLVPPYPNGRGFITKDATHFTTMAYEIVCKPYAQKIGKATGACAFSGTYSSPDLKAKDRRHALGDANTAYNVKVLGHTTPIVAAYRPAKPVVRPVPVKLATRVVPLARSGKVTAAPAAPYAKGAKVSLKASPARYWKLRRWLVGPVAKGAANPLVMTLNANTTVTADFTCRTGAAGGIIGRTWTKWGAEKKKLGCPTGAAKRLKNGDYTQRFEGGTITWVAKTKKVTVR